MLRSFVRTCILLLVSEEPAYGYELVERLNDIGVNVSDPGTLYRSLHTLEEQGFLDSRWEPSDNGGPDRRTYMITERGLRALHADSEALMTDEATLTAFLDRYRAQYADGRGAAAPARTDS